MSSGAAVSLLGYFITFHAQAAVIGGALFNGTKANNAFCVYNLPMTSSNWIKIILALILGIALGLVYGWVISPVEYTDVPPNILREDYRTDYVLMVAEAHQTEQDSETSARRLAILGSESPAQIVESALDFAVKNNFTQNEITLLQDLLTAMQTYQPQAINAP